MTTDADLAIDTRGLSDVPEIGAVLRGAGFVPGPNPGHWVAASDVAVDLMVVPHQARTAKELARAARLAPHDRLTARIARGLEPALVDHERVNIGARDHQTHDHRTPTSSTTSGHPQPDDPDPHDLPASVTACQRVMPPTRVGLGCREGCPPAPAAPAAPGRRSAAAGRRGSRRR